MSNMASMISQGEDEEANNRRFFPEKLTCLNFNLFTDDETRGGVVLLTFKKHASRSKMASVLFTRGAGAKWMLAQLLGGIRPAGPWSCHRFLMHVTAPYRCYKRWQRLTAKLGNIVESLEQFQDLSKPRGGFQVESSRQIQPWLREEERAYWQAGGPSQAVTAAAFSEREVATLTWTKRCQYLPFSIMPLTNAWTHTIWHFLKLDWQRSFTHCLIPRDLTIAQGSFLKCREIQIICNRYTGVWEISSHITKAWKIFSCSRKIARNWREGWISLRTLHTSIETQAKAPRCIQPRQIFSCTDWRNVRSFSTDEIFLS